MGLEVGAPGLGEDSQGAAAILGRDFAPNEPDLLEAVDRPRSAGAGDQALAGQVLDARTAVGVAVQAQEHPEPDVADPIPAPLARRRLTQPIPL
jgi:hypothetical protein